MNENLTNVKIFNTICDWLEQEEKDRQIEKLRKENEQLKEMLKTLCSFSKQK